MQINGMLSIDYNIEELDKKCQSVHDRKNSSLSSQFKMNVASKLKCSLNFL